jgi:hypothetical protein
MSMDSTSFADVSDVALLMCAVEVRVFDGEQSELRKVCATLNCCIQDIG